MSGGKLPEGWVDSILGDVLDVNSGVGFPIKFQGKNSGDYPVYKVSDISFAVTKNNGNLSTAGHYISKEEAVELKGKIFRPGSTAFAKIGEAVKLNRRAIVQSPGLADNNVMVISAVRHEMDKFIFHFMNTIDLSEQARSTTVPSIRKGDIENIRLALPSIYEQKIIAEKLDTLLAQVDSTKARLEQIPKILKRFRQAVLNTAVRGDLTKSWRENTQLTSMVELLEKCISLKSGKLRVRKNAITENYKNFISLPDSWTWSENYNLAKDNSSSICAGPFGTIFKAKDFRSEGIPIIFLRHVKEGVFNQNKPTFMDREIWEKLHQDYSIFGGELLVTKLGDPPGESCIYPQKFGTAMVTPDVLKMDVDNEIANTKYLMHYFNSPLAKKIIAELAFGATRLRIDIAMFKNFPVPLPSLEEQHEIVRRVEQLFAYADTIEKQVNSALTSVNSLTQSILAKAFRGELTAEWRAENPALISGENSAAALLEKIKAERAASGGKKTSRKKA
ncbi:TPA: restriction endonuclease subunit S [Klebsiella variicola]